MEETNIFKLIHDDPREFVRLVWGLEPQPIKEEFAGKVEYLIGDDAYGEIKAEWFAPFKEGKHYTWQQYLILTAVYRAVDRESKNRIAVRSGHGIGKSTCLSWILLWYLATRLEAQIPCTAPTTEQMNDVLWKEVYKWLERMPEGFKAKYEWTNTHIRITESPRTWFARAKTARKENPEALAGVHSENVAMVIDEASGIPEEIFTTAEGALTGKNTLVLMISNPTRIVGYFYEAFNTDRFNWQNLNFNSEDSPIVDEKYVQRIIDKYGRESEEYAVRVKGDFPAEDAMSEQGWLQLFGQLPFTNDSELIAPLYLGVDPAAGGKDTTAWVVRDNFKAVIVANEAISDPKGIAAKTYSIIEHYGIPDSHVFVDNFGVGADVAKQLALIEARKVDVNGVNVGEQCSIKEDKKQFLNKRAYAYREIKKWLLTGGELTNDKRWKELLSIRYKRQAQSGRMQIMPKLEMRKQGLDSPDFADALMLTFVEPPRNEVQRAAYTPNYSHSMY